MQIIFDNVKYKNFNNINFKIDDNKITGIIGPLGSGKTDLSLLIGSYLKPVSGSIIYDKKISYSNIGIISNFSFDDMLYGTVEQFIKKKSIEYKYKINSINKRIIEVLKMVGLSESILKESVFDISESEKIKVILSQILIYNPELIILDNIIEDLDAKSRTKLFKLLIKLKKFYNKTIVITSSNVDIIYEFCDNLIILYNNEILDSSDKFKVFENKDVLNNPLVMKPLVIEIKEKIKNIKNIDLGNNDSINELIKAIYRELR